MDELIINAKMDVQGFVAGTKRLESAIKSFGSSVDRSMKTVQGAGKSILSTIMKWGPALLGVGGAYSIISKSVNAFMSQNQQLQGTLTSCWTAIGNMLGPIITSIVNMIATVVSYLVTFLNLLGLTSKTASQAGQKASGAAQQLKKQLMGFDELNVMQDNQGGGGGSGGGLKDIEPSDWMKKLADLLKNKMWDEAADMIIKRMNDLIYTFRDKAYELGDKIGEYLGGALHVIARVIDEVDWHALGDGLARFINGMMNHINGEDIGKLIVAKFTVAFKILTGFLENLNWGRLGIIISDAVIAAINSVERAITGADFKKIGAGIRTFFESIDWQAITDAIFGLLEAAWNAAIDLLWGLLSKDSEEEPPIIASFRKLGESVEKVVRAAVPYLQQMLDKLLEFGGTAIKAVVDELVEFFNNLSELLSGKKSFAEFWGDLTPAATAAIEILGALTGIKAIIAGESLINGILKFTSGFKEGGLLGAIGKCLDKTNGLGDAVDDLGKNGPKSVGLLQKALEALFSPGGLVVAGLAACAAYADLSIKSQKQAIDNHIEEAEAIGGKTAALRTASEDIIKYGKELAGQLSAISMGYTEGAEVVNMLEMDVKRVYENVIQYSQEYINQLQTEDLTSEQVAEGNKALLDTIDQLIKIRDAYTQAGWSTKEIDEMLAEVNKQYNDVLEAQVGTMNKGKDAIVAAKDAALDEKDAVQGVKDVTADSEQTTKDLSTAVENLGTATSNAKGKVSDMAQEVENLGEKGTPAAKELGSGYTAEINEQSSSMEAATTAAGNKAGVGLETGLKETDPAMLADEFVDSFNTELSSKTPEIEATTQQMAKTAVSAAQAEIQSGTDAISQIIQLSVNSIVQTIQMCGTQINQSVQASTNYVVESFSMVQRSVTTSMTAVNNLVTQVFQNMVELSSRAGIAVANNYTAGMTQLYTSATNVAVQLNNTFGSYFGQIAQNGYVWGKDLGILFNNGLVDACNAYLMPTLQQVAQSIKNVIGFSKPKEGPLSDADTYMPDFMQLLTKGVKDNMDKPLDAVQDLADGVREELENGDYKFGDFEANQLDVAFAGFADQFLNGFGSMIDRLESIADKVIYEMPDVAAGNVVPYSVSQELSQNMGASPASLEDVVSAIDALRALMTQNNGENAGFNITVLLDGEQIESAVTTRQRRKRIAQGA